MVGCCARSCFVGPAGAGADGAETFGGQQVLIYGTSFGPPAANAITNITYGKTGVEYVAQACTVLVDSNTQPSQIQCVTAPGTGANLMVSGACTTHGSVVLVTSTLSGIMA